MVQNSKCIVIFFTSLFLIPINPIKVGQEVWGVGGREKGNIVAPKREKGELGAPKGKRDHDGKDSWDRAPLSNQTTRKPASTHAPHDMKRLPTWAHH